MEESTDKKSNLAFIVFLVIFVSLGVYLFIAAKSAPGNQAVTEGEVAAPLNVETVTEVTEEPVAAQRQNGAKITINGSNFKFEPNIISAKVGDKIIVEFVNTEGFHDFKIDEFNAATKKLSEGETETLEFIVDRAGSFEFYCSVGEHRKMGMVGTLVVEE